MELDLFQKILDLLLRKHNNFCMSMSDCINIVGDNDTRSFTKVNAEDFINKMIELNYFTKVYKDKKVPEDKSILHIKRHTWFCVNSKC